VAVKRLKPFLKLAALASSVLLVAGCVSYRAGVLDWLKPAGASSADGSDGNVDNPKLMSGSKVGIFLPEDDSQPTSPSGEAKPDPDKSPSPK
jgi:hypothetical protein